MIRAALAVIAALLLATPASAAPLRAIDRGPIPVSFMQADGERFLFWNDSASNAAKTYDVVTHTHTTIPAPRGCGPTEVSHLELLWNCGWPFASEEIGVVRNLVTGTTTVVQQPAQKANFGLDPWSFSGLGRFWVRVTHQEGRNYETAYVNRTTGVVARPDDANRRLLIDPNLPELTRPLCSGMRRPLVEWPTGFGGTQPIAGPLTVVGRYAVGVSNYTNAGRAITPELLLLQCGRKPKLLTRCGGPCAGPALGRAHVAWSRGRDVSVRSLLSGKTRRVRLRASPRQLVLLRGQVFATVRGRLVEIRR